MTRFQRLAVVVIGLSLLATVCAAYFVRQSLLASHFAVMGRFATNAVCDFVTEHDGKWPSSWSDLEPYLADEKFSPSIRQVIVIDFHSDPKRLAAQSVGEFTAIRSTQGVASDSQELKEYWEVPRLLSLLKRAHGRTE